MIWSPKVLLLERISSEFEKAVPPKPLSIRRVGQRWECHSADKTTLMVTWTRLQNQSPTQAELYHGYTCSCAWWNHYTWFSPLWTHSQTRTKGLVLANTTFESKVTNRLFFVVVLRLQRVEIQVSKEKELANMPPLLLFVHYYLLLNFHRYTTLSEGSRKLQSIPHVHKSPLPQPGKSEVRSRILNTFNYVALRDG